MEGEFARGRRGSMGLGDLVGGEGGLAMRADSPLAAFELISHRLLRYASPCLHVLAFLANCVLLGDGWFYYLTFVVQLGIVGAAVFAAYLPQTADIDRSFPIAVFDFVATGLWRSTGFFGGMNQGARERITQALAAVGLNGFEHRPIGTLSGGQMQRLLFARVMLQDAPVIVLDEPFNAIDARTAADLLGLVRRWHAEQRTVLAALHDIDLVRANFPETLLLARGKVAWGATAEVLTSENLLAARRMCEAFDDSAAACAVDDLPSRAA